MKKLSIFLMVMALGGCTLTAQLVPSLKYCDEVKYQRKGTAVDVEVKCVVPLGE